MLDILGCILPSVGICLLILPFAIAICALIGLVVGKCLDKYLKNTNYIDK